MKRFGVSSAGYSIMSEMKRCAWVRPDPLYEVYHDKEWGVPVHDDRELFEMLILEGAQAGLSWFTILKKRENYRRAFKQFDPEKIARFTDKNVEALMGDEGIVRNRLKVLATITNDRSYLALREGGITLDSLLWQFVNGKPVQNAWTTRDSVPAKTAASDAMSRELLRRGFKFVGSTICYAFMQGVGMVNDHSVDCQRYREVAQLR